MRRTNATIVAVVFRPVGSEGTVGTGVTTE
jgi:hypothetical protein